MAEVNKEDLAVIRELEKLASREIPWIEGRVLLDYEVGYQTDEDGRIVGLSLSKCSIKDISPMCQLRNLTKLDLSYNQLTSVPKGIKELKNLTVLDLSNTQLAGVPEWIKELKSLTVLNLSNTQLASVPEGIKELKNLTGLYLSNNQLVGIPKWIKELENLTVFHLSYNRLTNVPEGIKELKNLTGLDLSNTQLTSVPEWIKELKNLTVLSLPRNQLTSVPEGIKELKNLTVLYLSRNQLTSVPEWIKELTNLTGLYLSKNQLTSIPEGIKELKNLTELDFSCNQLASVPEGIRELKSLTKLHLGDNQITDIESLNKLKNLIELDLWNNNITDIKSLGNLENLVCLRLWNNKISDIAPIENLKNLKILHLNANRIRDIEPISKLTNLVMLDLNKNLIVDIRPLSELKNIKSVNLVDNWIKELPETILNLDLRIVYRNRWAEKGEFVLWDNPLEVPPVEVVKQGKWAIRNYLRFLKQEKEKGLEKFRLYEAKLLIVGRGDVGKTWLTHRLITGKLPEKDGTTRGVDIHVWQFNTGNIKDFRANFWDFGGQQILHSTHQFFLTNRSLYLFVWEARTDDDVVSFDYWLNIIKLLSDSSPVIVVMNKCDERIKNIDEQTYAKNFNILGFYKVSAKENIGIKELRSRIQEEMAKLPQIGTTLPQAWTKIRQKLEGLKTPYISYREYCETCKEFELDKTQADYLSGYYHNVGVILHFQDNPVLQETVFLQPEWVTEAVYQVVENLEVQKKNGRFQYKQLAGILDTQQYPVEIHHKLLELMKKFELCFELDGKNEYILPELLKGDRPKFEWDYQNNLQFEYEYKFMPAGIITRFISRVHELHKNELYWKNGVVLNWEGHTQALVVSEMINRKIRIWIRGQDTKGLLAIIRYHIGHIHETLNRPEVEQMLPCICKQCQQNREPYFHKYQELLIVQEKGKDARCNKSAEDISIEKLFGEYGMEEDYDERKRVRAHIEVNPIINVSPIFQNTQTQRSIIETKKSKTTVWGWVWKIVAGLIVLVGGLYSCIKIWESDTVQKWINKGQTQKQVDKDKSSEEKRDTPPLVSPEAK